MRIALSQLNPVVGDVSGNAQRIGAAWEAAAARGAALVIFPEQALLGYPSKDFLLRPEYIAANMAALADLAIRSRDVAAVVGFAEPNPEPAGRPLYNSAALLAEGRVAGVVRKRLLPTYDVFDEARYFEPAGPQQPVRLDRSTVGLSICEDMWSHDEFRGRRLYAADPLGDLVSAGAEWLINISASPFWLDKQQERIELLRAHAVRLGRTIVFVNQVGGNDDLVFDGASCVVDAAGRVCAQARSFAEDLLLVDLPAGPDGALARAEAPAAAGRCEPVPSGCAALYEALRLGLQDYVRKCGFRQVVIGLSGGVDSAVVAVLAADALGAAQVHGVAMPSRYSSDHSLADARELATNLGIRFSTIPIEPLHAAYEATLAPSFEGRPADVTEENIQARVRGALLMALSNKFGGLLLTTGNKSELAVGYCTLYGDMCGGLAVISDVPKSLVYELARWINAQAGRPRIPLRSITKPPSAELRPNQLDQDTLPPYEELDEIIDRYEARFESAAEIVAAGFDRARVEQVIRLLHTSEYKRQQAAPGIKVTSRAFGFGRRMPIAARQPAAGL